jgi:carbohydrate-selective porin OprB
VRRIAAPALLIYLAAALSAAAQTPDSSTADGLFLQAAALSAAAQTPDSSTGDGLFLPLNGLFLRHGQAPIGAETRAYVAPQVEHLLGSWGGIRSDLDDWGIHLLLDATAEFAGNVSGGIKQGATSANQVAFEAD